MIKHLVMWKLKDMDGKQKERMLNEMKRELEALNGQIEGLISLEVGLDFLQSEASYDLVLSSVFGNKVDLDHYQAHPLHVKVATELIKPNVKSRILVDYEF